MEEGIKKIFPEAETSYDDFGNLLAEVNGTRFYPNPRGLDAPTTAQLGGATALAMGLEGCRCQTCWTAGDARIQRHWGYCWN
jgi:hypothetical protein